MSVRSNVALTKAGMMIYLQRAHDELFPGLKPRGFKKIKNKKNRAVEEHTMNEVLKNIYTVNLGVKKDERALVFTDLVRKDEALDPEELKKRADLRKIALEVAEAGKGLCEVSFFEFPAVEAHGKEPPKELWVAAFGQEAVNRLDADGLLEKILEKTIYDVDDNRSAERLIDEFARTPDVVIALSNFSTSHTRFRSYLTRLKRVRYASMPLFERFMLDGAMKADWNAVASRTNRLVEMMTGGDTVVVTSHNGTSISFSMQRREVQPDTGILTAPGSFGNLPAGEAFLAPVEGTAEGTLILEWSPTKKLRESITLEVAKGRVVKVLGTEKYAEVLREKLAINPLMGNIAELGIGTNDKATRPDNILETEKILGTVHIALGDNASFGGRVSVPFHQDFIFYRPTLEVIKREERTALIIEGEPQF